MLDETAREVLETAEVVTIATQGPDGPHLVATWGDYVRTLGTQERGKMVIPVGGMRRTEENLRADNRVVLLAGSRKARGGRGTGQGCRITGEGSIVTSGEDFDRVRANFTWARGALVVRVTGCEKQL